MTRQMTRTISQESQQTNQQFSQQHYKDSQDTPTFTINSTCETFLITEQGKLIPKYTPIADAYIYISDIAILDDVNILLDIKNKYGSTLGIINDIPAPQKIAKGYRRQRLIGRVCN